MRDTYIGDLNLNTASYTELVLKWEELHAQERRVRNLKTAVATAMATAIVRDIAEDIDDNS